MSSTPSLLALGLLLGVRHALDPDHVVAVTAIVSRHPSLVQAARVGALWGIGHAATVLVIGGIIAWFRIAISPQLSHVLEFLVALMLIVIGVTNVRSRGAAPAAAGGRPLIVGMVHGLAGSAAIAVLVLAAVPDPRQALGYLALFATGTIVGMTGVTTLLAVPLAAAADRVASSRRMLLIGSGVASIAVGVWIATSLVGKSGLLTRAATP